VDWQAVKGELGDLVVPTVIVAVFAAALWSNRTRARKLAQKWGIPDPTSNQVDEVLHYRRLRLACYPLLFVMIGMCSGLFVSPTQNHNSSANDDTPLIALILMFLCGAVIAELLALRRTRQLQPVRFRFVDVVSRWGVGVYGALVVVTFVLGLIDLQAQPYITPKVVRVAEQNQGHVGIPIAVPFAVTAVVLLLTGFVFWSTCARSFSADIETDRALRTRSARVVLGLGIGMQLLLLGLSWWRMEFVADHYFNEPDFVTIGGGAFVPDPAEVATRDWAQQVRDSVQPWTLLISAVAVGSWSHVANPDVRRRFRCR
jgi:hypothetical protein